MNDTINAADFNAAVTQAIATVQPLLLALEALQTTPEQEAAAQALHAALADLLVQADALGNTGGAHTDDGGQGKGGNQN